MTVGSQVKGCYSSLKSAEATLELLANKTQDQQTKKVYQEITAIIQDVKSDLKEQVIYLSREEPQYKS